MSPQSLLLQRYSNVLIRVPTAGDRVCLTCHRDTNGSSRCFQCAKHAATSTELCDVVVPISLSIKGEQLAHELWHYKNSKSPEVRRKLTDGLAFVLANFLHRHEVCLAAAAGVSEFDLVTTVPASAPRGEVDPLVAILRNKLGATRSRFEELLKSSGPNERELAPARFTASRDLAGQAVLLVDDTWTSGASMQSAAMALKRAGARRVAGLVIGRHFDATRDTAASYLGLARSWPFDWDGCCLCHRT